MAFQNIKQTRIFQALSRAFAGVPATPPIISVYDLPEYSAATTVTAWQDGDKYPGGFGPTKLFFEDLWALRWRSEQLFKENLYAVGLLRRFITNEINTGLTLEAIPAGGMLGLDDEFLTDWSEDAEARFAVWAQNPQQCDWLKSSTFGALQRMARLEALITGDVLAVLRQDPVTKLPRVQLVSGHVLQTPLSSTPKTGNQIIHGVEIDNQGRHVAYHIVQRPGNLLDSDSWGGQLNPSQYTGEIKRLPAFGTRSGRRMAWLIYGTQRRLGRVRGEPLLSIILQSLKEIDRYRDSEQRAAVLNAILAMVVEKENQLPGSKPLTGGAVRKGTVETTEPDGVPRTFNAGKFLPGLTIDELQAGEKIKSHDTTRPNVNFAAFESAVIQAIAWANEMPPEILQLAFSKNYSASRGAVNEYKLYLNKSRSERADEFDKPVYVAWLLSQVLTGKIQAPGLLEAWRDPLKQDIYGAWILSDWGGAIKPSVDMLKEANGYKIMNQEGWITNDRASKELTGTKFSTNVKRIKQENILKAEAMRPILELKKEFGDAAVDGAAAFLEDKIRIIAESVVEDAREDGEG